MKLIFLASLLLGFSFACGEQEQFARKEPTSADIAVSSPDVIYPEPPPASYPPLPVPVAYPPYPTGPSGPSDSEFAETLVKIQQLECVETAVERRSPNSYLMQGKITLPSSGFPRGITILVRNSHSVSDCQFKIGGIVPFGQIQNSSPGVLILEWTAPQIPQPVPSYDVHLDIIRSFPCVQSASAIDYQTYMVYVWNYMDMTICMNDVYAAFPASFVSYEKDRVFRVQFQGDPAPVPFPVPAPAGP